MDSILNTIKRMLGLAEDYDAFDVDIIVGINSAFMTLTQLGVGPSTGFSISDDKPEWKDFADPVRYSAAKTYIYQKVRLGFDNITSSSVIESLQRSNLELEWRLNLLAEEDGAS